MSKPQHWPKRWRQHHGAIYYQVPPGQEHEWEGKKMFRLGKSEPEAWKTWFEMMDEVEEGVPKTIGQAMDRYIIEVLPDKAQRTQEDYMKAIGRLRPVFGHMPPKALKPRHVYKYMDKRPATRANREKSTLSAIMSECVRWGAVDRNLVREVRRNEEKPRDRYVEDAELKGFKKHATPMILAYLEIRMLTGLRQGQILDLQRSAWDGKRLKAPGAKGGKTVIYEGPGLAGAVNGLLKLSRKGSLSMYLLSSRNGTRYTSDGFRSIWHRCMKKYCEAGGERFTENDLRAKVASDSRDLSTAAGRLGHQDERTTNRVYRRKPATVSVLRSDEK
jgi:integrase